MKEDDVIEVRRGDLRFEWRLGRIVDIYRGEAAVPFDCTSLPGHREVTEEVVEGAAQRWIDAQPSGPPPPGFPYDQ